MSEVIAAIIGAILGGLVIHFLPRIFPGKKSPITESTAKLARQSLRTAQYVLYSSTAFGGHLGYPWYDSAGNTIDQGELDDQLRDACARIHDEAFDLYVGKVRGALKGIYSLQYAGNGQGADLDKSVYRERAKFANEQLAIARPAIEQADLALVLLDRFSRYL